MKHLSVLVTGNNFNKQYPYGIAKVKIEASKAKLSWLSKNRNYAEIFMSIIST